MSVAKIYDHTLDAVKGWIPGNMGALDYNAPLSANVTIVAYQGRVVHLNADGEFEMGCTGKQMPIFLLRGSDSLDVTKPQGTDEAAIRLRNSQNGNLNGLVATGGFELSTTEFDTAQTYAPNDSLRAVASNSNQTTGGRITNQSVAELATSSPQNATAICGRVSRGVLKNMHKKDVLYFWPVHIPGAPNL